MAPKRILMSLFACLLVAVPCMGASAHERQQIGDLELVVGWAAEPAYVGSHNAVQLRVSRGGQPVEAAHENLRVEVRFGDESTGPRPLRPVFGEPGEYRSDLLPTRPGAYTFHFTGEIDGDEIDQSFGPPGFDEVQGTADVEFPVQDPSRAELAQSMERLGPRLDDAVAAAESADGTARVALVAGLAGLLAGLVALALALTRRRGTPAG